MNNLLLIFKGFIIGIAKILPGVSGAVLAISLGIYERILCIIAHPFKINYSDLKFLFFLFSGAALGIATFSSGIMWCLDKFYLPTIMLFIGFIVGGIPEITSEIKKSDFSIFNIFILIISFSIVIFLTSLSSSSVISSNHYFIMGSIESLTTIIPGISGTAIFMALGWYESLLNTINMLLTFKAPIFISFNFLSGFIISTILISRIINYTFKKYRVKSYLCVLGFMSGSLFTMIYSLIRDGIIFYQGLFGLFLFFLGFYLTIKINHLFASFK